MNSNTKTAAVFLAGLILGALVIGGLAAIIGMRRASSNDPTSEENAVPEYLENIISFKEPEGYKNAVSRHSSVDDLERHYYFDDRCLDISLMPAQNLYAAQASEKIRTMKGNTLEENNRELLDINGFQYAVEIHGYTTKTEYVPDCEINASCFVGEEWVLDIIYTNGNEGDYKSFSREDIDQFIAFLNTIYAFDDPNYQESEDEEDDDELEGDAIDSLIRTEIAGEYYVSDDDDAADKSAKTFELDNGLTVDVIATRAGQKEIDEFNDDYGHLKNNMLAENGREAMEFNGIRFSVQEGGTVHAGDREYYQPATSIYASCVIGDNIIEITMNNDSDESLTQEDKDDFVAFLKTIKEK